MRTRCWSWASAALVLLATSLSVLADEGGSNWSWWNPFTSQKSGSKKVSASVSDGKTSGQSSLKLPSLPKMSLPTMSTGRTSVARRSPAGAQPSTWDKMTRSTKEFFSKTYDLLTPWDNHKSSPPKPPTHSGTGRGPSSNKSSSWWPWSKTEESKEPQTVNEFIAQPRVTP
jgi:hypothetical protein